MSDDTVEDAVLQVLSQVDEGATQAALEQLVQLSSRFPGHAEVADAWAVFGDSGAARGPFGLTLLTALIPIARGWPDARGRSTMMMALAELEVTHREVTWAALAQGSTRRRPGRYPSVGPAGIDARRPSKPPRRARHEEAAAADPPGQGRAAHQRRRLFWPDHGLLECRRHVRPCLHP